LKFPRISDNAVAGGLNDNAPDSVALVGAHIG